MTISACRSLLAKSTPSAIRLLAIGLLSASLWSCSSGSNNSSGPSLAPVVQTALGPVQGISRNGAYEYRGMPYALAPTGNLRWALPQPVTASWTNIFQAYDFGPACPQQARFGLTEESLNEDCLSINVSVPADIKPGEKLPVFFWIHGGAFVGGSSSLYRLDKLAREGRLVVVSANYRLGVLGFMPNSAFASNGYNGNYGLEDQRLAMKWVQDNIEAFGGDKNNVTIAGESAGAGSTCMHLASPDQVVSQSNVKVKNLFQKAIVQSAGCLQAMPTVSEAESTLGTNVQASLHCAGAADVLACMRGKTVAAVLDAQGSNSSGIVSFSPVTGNNTVPNTFKDVANAGGLVNVPMMMGGTRTELLLYMGYFWQEVQGQVNSGLIDYWMSLFYPVNDLQVIKAQPKYQNISSADGDLATEALGIALSDYNPAIGLNNCLYLHTSDTILNGRSVNLPIYQFEFADAAAPVCGVGIAGTCPPFLKNGSPVHSSELNYLFPNLSNTKAINAPDLAPASQALANQMVAYWAKFAYTGDPNGNALPTWLPYAGKTTPFGGSSVQLLDTNNNVRPYNSDNQHQCSAFWRGQYSQFLQ